MFNVNVKKKKVCAYVCVLVCTCHGMREDIKGQSLFLPCWSMVSLASVVTWLTPGSLLLSFWCVLLSSFPSMNARVTDVHLSSTRKPAFQSRVHSDLFLSGTASASMSLPLLTIYLTVYPLRMLYPLMHSAASSPVSHFPNVWPLNIKDPVFNELLGGTFEIPIKASRNTVLGWKRLQRQSK